jgi:hypothetical protein
MRLTQKEYDDLHKSAKRAGLPLATYMRFMMRGCCPKERPPGDWFKFYSELCDISNNLNHLTHTAFHAGDINAGAYRQFRDDLDELLIALMDEFHSPEKLNATKIIQEAMAKSEQAQPTPHDILDDSVPTG